MINAKYLGKLIFLDFGQTITSLEETSDNSTFFIADEFGNFGSHYVGVVLEQVRSFNTVVILSYQSFANLRNIGGDNFKSQIINNTSTLIAHRLIDMMEAEEVANLYGVDITCASEIKSLKVGQALVRSISSYYGEIKDWLVQQIDKS
ncbi:type IV secretion system DNA-binding domain-containing protein [Mycoplasmoides pneumoniae]|nr:conserved hypothetical protein [Mycoplasmoides pneumoniae FH]VEU56945.1 TraM recognition site of TraD and TraG [Mycoplasmoides pneumoniae]GLL57681.1 hypothetical protein KPI25BX_4430 [Mycoplasmoides pneumoniae]GLL57964.1 hypothetical protein Y1241N_0110 [Mycoplasmoides pneumoniae]GLL58976.1 hypothetical protein Y12242BV_3000 [Mycoplasmoides pneumoniae]